jgi:hypothetical protein
MEPRIALIDATLGAVVTDLDLSRMDARTWKTVEQAFHEYHWTRPRAGASPGYRHTTLSITLRPRSVTWFRPALGTGFYGEVRVMRHTRVAGDPATELSPTDRDDRASAYEPTSSNR